MHLWYDGTYRVVLATTVLSTFSNGDLKQDRTEIQS